MSIKIRREANFTPGRAVQLCFMLLKPIWLVTNFGGGIEYDFKSFLKGGMETQTRGNY